MHRTGHILLTTVIVILIATDSNSQSFNSKYNFKHLTVQHGLAQNIVYHFLQDNHGYLWIGTHNGLTLYDGTKTINFQHKEDDSTSIAGNFITSILEDDAHQIWIGHENGINRYNRADHSFSLFSVDRPGGKKDTTYCVLLGFVSSTELWFLDTKTRSVRSLDTKTKATSFVSELNASHASMYLGAEAGTFYIWSSYDKGTIFQLYRNKRLSRQETFFTGSAVDEPVVEVSHVVQQNDTTAWLATNEGLVRLNPIARRYQFFNTWQKKTAKEFRFAALSPAGELWVASGAAGVYTFDTRAGQFTANFGNDKTDPLSICSNNIVSLYFDKVGNLWCGSYGSGASYTNVENVFFNKHVSKNDTHPWENDNKVASISCDRYGNLWCLFANNRGPIVLDRNLNFKDRIHPLLEDGSPIQGYTNKLLFDMDEDRAWYATSKGLFLYNIRTNRAREVKYPLISKELMGSKWINDIIRLKDSSIIFSTFNGVYWIVRKGNNFIIKPFLVEQDAGSAGFRKIFQDQEGFIYIKPADNALYILAPGTAEGDYVIVKRMNFPAEINHYFYDKTSRTTYFATEAGLYQLNTADFILQKNEINTKLPFSNISSVFKKENILWLFGDKGLYCFDETQKTGRTYTIEDGLPANEFSISSLAVSHDGKCIAGCSNGLISFFPHEQPANLYPPRPQFSNIYINDIPYTATINVNETRKINLTYRQNTFSFDFAPITFHRASECSFEYRLNGYDESWIKSGNIHYTRYSKIPPGNYLFEVRVIDAMGNLSPFTKSVEVQVAPAFWQTTLFKAGFGLLVLLAAWFAWKLYFNYRIRKQKVEFEKKQAIEKERTRIATDMHDDLGAGLTRIKFLSQSILRKNTGGPDVKAELEKITSFSDEMTEKMGEIVWALNEKNDTIADLVAYTRSYATAYLAQHNIQCIANTPLGLPGTFIAGEIRRNIFLSVKECLHNVVKHAGATMVRFIVTLGDKIEIIIHDDGRGIDWNNQRAFSNGIANIRQRMKEINGEVKFYNDNGTKVVLLIPVNL